MNGWEGDLPNPTASILPSNCSQQSLKEGFLGEDEEGGRAVSSTPSTRSISPGTSWTGTGWGGMGAEHFSQRKVSPISVVTHREWY